ncbi:MAG: MFS transporter, partial [Actinobacteria bacterium]|nr:MFS transporter [Actinomycetota bacterium]
LFAVYPLGLAPALVLSGPASDVLGRRAVMVPGIVLSGLSSAVLIAGADHLWLLYLGRFLLGVVSGLVFVVASAWMAEHGRDAPLWTARMLALVMYGGFGLGPLVAGIAGQWLPAPTAWALSRAYCNGGGGDGGGIHRPRDGDARPHPQNSTESGDPRGSPSRVLDSGRADRARSVRDAVARVRTVPGTSQASDARRGRIRVGDARHVGHGVDRAGSSGDRPGGAAPGCAARSGVGHGGLCTRTDRIRYRYLAVVVHRRGVHGRGIGYGDDVRPAFRRPVVPCGGPRSAHRCVLCRGLCRDDDAGGGDQHCRSCGVDGGGARCGGTDGCIAGLCAAPNHGPSRDDLECGLWK